MTEAERKEIQKKISYVKADIEKLKRELRLFEKEE